MSEQEIKDLEEYYEKEYFKLLLEEIELEEWHQEEYLRLLNEELENGTRENIRSIR